MLFAGWQWLLVPNFSVRCTFCQSMYFPIWLLINFNFSEAWSESTFFLPWSSELQVRGIWRRSSELLSSESLALGLQKLDFCLQNFQHLIRNTIFRSWDCSSELPVSESWLGFLAKHGVFRSWCPSESESRSSEALQNTFFYAINFWWVFFGSES